MRIAVVTLFARMVREALAYGVVGRSIERGVVTVDCYDPRDHAADPHRTVDYRPYGGGPGMVLKYEPTAAAIRSAVASFAEPVRRIYLGAEGRRFDQALAREAVQRRGLVLVAGRYEGVDERLIEAEIDECWSIGDYVLSGGELPALVVIDAVARLLPGTLGAAESAEQESFSDGLLDWPHYSRPAQVRGRRVPAVLGSGDHGAIRRWRLREALGRTWLRRPEMLARRGMSAEERELLDEFKAERARRAGRDDDDSTTRSLK